MPAKPDRRKPYTKPALSCLAAVPETVRVELEALAAARRRPAHGPDRSRPPRRTAAPVRTETV